MATSELQAKILRRQTKPGEYKVYKAALEWDLTDPIVIESEKDFKSSPRWQDRLTPYHHQVTNLITFCRRLPVTLLADDVGLGKTISAGLIISELAARARLSKVLVVCPKLLGSQWKSELESKFDIPAEIATGRALLDADPVESGAVITTYQSARLYLERLPEDRFQMLVLDEAHKLRNLYGVESVPKVAKVFRNALEARRFRFVLMLTATPIHNRLWDLYSLVDLLTVARGHENPFGSTGQFARQFIADKREQARQLKPEAREQFRSIVYGYMSRVRRGDAKLLFPGREVQMHRVEPTAAELQLIRAIGEPIKRLNRLAQISILQALTSSPEALKAQLLNMARNGTVPWDLAQTVKQIVESMPRSAKLNGLAQLIETLKQKNPKSWRLVIFTGRRETQTTIQLFLESVGMKVGIVNGESGPRNQETIQRFWKNPPDIRAIVSTEAGSEGVNLQVANVLVNYDLPWNPMIVEQRIGRVQRLASEHANVSIFNIMLRGTFEEYIVGRLVEKLQMASHAIGDIEALLQGADVGDGDEDVAASFEDQILKLVLAALEGKDVTRDTELKLASIENAKAELEREEANINAMLGSMDGAEYVGPRAPTLPLPERSMESRDFTLAALENLGYRLTPQASGEVLSVKDSAREYIRFDGKSGETRSTLYSPGAPAFQRLVSNTIATGVHDVEDLDVDAPKAAEQLTRQWVESFGGQPRSVETTAARRQFDGNALLRVRATVAHDSYERLVEIPSSKDDNRIEPSRDAIRPIGRTLENPLELGLNAPRLASAAIDDPAISEFSRFYLERREQEKAAAGNDDRKRQKLHEDFTPRVAPTLVGLRGKLHREFAVRARYGFDADQGYESTILVDPQQGQVREAPELGLCASSGKTAPVDCLSVCQMTGGRVLRHLLARSERSGRLALPEFTVVCALSGKRLLADEVEPSVMTGALVDKLLLGTSSVSGRRAEPEHFERCEFTAANLLKDELAVSDVSGRLYRLDQNMRSAVTGKMGHRKEFLTCHETLQPVELVLAETCEVTGHKVRPGVLVACEETNRRVLPSELERCSVTGKRVLRSLLVTSSISEARILRSAALQSSRGSFCAPTEAKTCFWSGKASHPDDTRTCSLTGLLIHSDFAVEPGGRLRPLVELLEGMLHDEAEMRVWEDVGQRISRAVGGRKCQVEAAVQSPNHDHLALVGQTSGFLGLRKGLAGAVVRVRDRAIIGRIARGRRTPGGFVREI
ncbi:MAG: DEAD/DEAH box helicase [Bauldia sp.]|nr:DEAD/DEAH box helicase [Bauldia sp.]